MTETLPQFRYHSAPLLTGVVEENPKTCVCCDRVRGFIYMSPVYGEADLDGQLCPWCIADGSAATKLGASFADSYPLERAGIARAIVDEVNLRTPSYVSWQQDSRLTHCADACEFRGDASVEHLTNASQETRAAWRREYQLTDKEWVQITEGYQWLDINWLCSPCTLVVRVRLQQVREQLVAGQRVVVKKVEVWVGRRCKAISFDARPVVECVGVVGVRLRRQIALRPDVASRRALARFPRLRSDAGDSPRTGMSSS